MDRSPSRDQPMVSLVMIDDHRGSLELLSSALAQPNLRILTAEDPESGLELVYRHRPQIVLTDLVMPKLSGLEVLDRIVAFDSNINVILMTAHYSTESAVDAIKRGAFDYLNKPVRLPALRERISQVIEEIQHRAQATHREDEFA